MALKALAIKVCDFSGRKFVDWVRAHHAHSKAKRMTDCLAATLDERYLRRRNSFLAEILDGVLSGKPLDESLQRFDGTAFDERVAEYPYVVSWLSSHDEGLDLLDVGCVMNHGLVDAVVGAHCRSLWLCNPAMEALAVTSVPVFYHVSPLKDAFPNGQQFPLVTCLSTLEHVGYDNSHYGVKEPPRYTEPSTEPFVVSFRRLAALTAPGGSLLISFPFGRREVLIHPWTAKPASQVLDYASLQECLPALIEGGLKPKVEVFAAKSSGWEQVDPASCQARYADGCPAAAAVAFVTGKKPVPHSGGSR